MPLTGLGRAKPCFFLKGQRPECWYGNNAANGAKAPDGRGTRPVAVAGNPGVRRGFLACSPGRDVAAGIATLKEILVIRTSLAALVLAAALAGCAQVPPATEAALPSGIQHTGQAGMTGGSAAAPAGVGSLTTHP